MKTTKEISGTFISPDESCELGYFKEGNKLYAGYISNSGCNKEWCVDYDDDLSVDDNLEGLFEYVYETYDISNEGLF